MRPWGTGVGALLLACLIGAAPAAARPLARADTARPGGGRPTERLRPGAHSPAPRARSGMAAIPAGSYLPLYGSGRIPVPAFAIDRYPVTREEFAAFLREHPEWRRSRAPRALVGAGYLASWRDDLDFGSGADAARPVTEVSRPAAEAYCAAQGQRLPTADEWEYVAGASPGRRDATGDAAFKQRLIELYTRPRAARPGEVGSTFRNAFGVWDLHGLVWEWTAARMAMAHHALRHGAPAAHDMGCAGSAAGATDTRNYAAFLRYAFRDGLTSTTTLSSLGFRCAR